MNESAFHLPNALITGGAKRVGAEMARRFVAEGFRVAIHYNASHGEAEALQAELNAGGDMCRIFSGDLRDRADLTRVFRAAQAWLGEIHLLLNNASMFVNDDITAIEDQVFDDHYAVNLQAPVYLSGLMAEQAEGLDDCLIINMLDNKLFALNPDFLTYTISKSALLTATHMLARRFMGKPRVCGIAPSITLISGKQTQENFEKSATINPLGRRVHPDDLCAAAVHFWKTKSCNDDIIKIDGGQTLWHLPRDVAFLVKEGLTDGDL